MQIVIIPRGFHPLTLKYKVWNKPLCPHYTMHQRNWTHFLQNVLITSLKQMRRKILKTIVSFYVSGPSALPIPVPINSYQSIAVTDSHLASLFFCAKQLPKIMTVFNVMMKFRAAISTNLHFKMRGEQYIVKRNVQLIFLTESRHFEENRFLERPADISFAADIAIGQISWQESTTYVDLDRMSYVILWNCLLETRKKSK